MTNSHHTPTYSALRLKISDFLKDKNQKTLELSVPKNLKLWRLVNPFTLLYRKTVFFAQQWIIPSRFKNWLLRTAGVHVGDDVCIPHYIHFDPYFPELITIGPGTLIGGLSQLHTHEINSGKLVLGRIHIHEKVLVAGFSTLYPGVTVNKHVITGMRSHIRKDCPEGSFVVGTDRVAKMWTPDEIEKYFGASKHDPNYYDELSHKAKAFRNTPSMMRVSIRNNGNRLNPGNEWYLARSWPRIFYNAFFVELARVAPTSGIRTFLLRCIGAHIGKNVHLGKGIIFDHIYGDLVTLEDNVFLDDDVYLDGHSYTISESVFGRVLVKEGARIGKRVHVMCGVTIGKNARVLDDSSILRDVSDGETWQGIPAKKIEEKK